jgi:2-phosphosulfolactate phosphatase
MPFFDREQFDLRCEWALEGIQKLARSDVVIIVDVLSFSTAVDVALGRGAIVFPYRWKDESAIGYARERQAHLAGPRSRAEGSYSLSPSSLVSAPTGLRLVLPSPNGSNLAFAALSSGQVVLTGCLRNASAVAAFASRVGKRISVIPAGEHWPDGTLRPASEHLIGAGAILNSLPAHASPEALLAINAFHDFHPNLRDRVLACASGRELVERGFERDVEIATEFDISDTVPSLQNDAFVAANSLDLDAPPAIG